MTRRVFVTLLAAALSATTAYAQPAKNATINIGLASAFFYDVPETLVTIAVEPFSALMKQTTGLDGILLYKDDAFEVARKLEKGELQVGVFHGHEFAWLQKNHPRLKPLMVAVNVHRDVSAYVIVNKNNPAKSIIDLRGKTLDMPEGTKEHCRVFLEKHCADNAQQNIKSYFKTVSKTKSAIQAIDNVAFGKVDAVLIDTITLEFYKNIKGPAFNNFCRVLGQPGTFPPPVIVYKEGGVDAPTLAKMHSGLNDAHKLDDAQDLFKMWQLDRFLPVPNDYSRSLTESLKAYPLPAGALKTQVME
jgi:ABC-type phosphate/phosphonate transport system substrate-binding protein